MTLNAGGTPTLLFSTHGPAHQCFLRAKYKSKILAFSIKSGGVGGAFLTYLRIKVLIVSLSENGSTKQLVRFTTWQDQVLEFSQ
jgi:hypothetical protein